MIYNIGDIVEGCIVCIKNYGLFIKNDEINMFCHISKISDKFVNIFNDFKIGDKVFVKIIEINNDRYNVTMKDVKSKVNIQKSSFEDLLKKYLNSSDEKINDMNRRIKKRYK